jgi:hypothetical protein
VKKFLSIGPLGPGYKNISLHLKTEIEPVSETLLFYLKTRAMDKVQVNNLNHSDSDVRNTKTKALKCRCWFINLFNDVVSAV